MHTHIFTVHTHTYILSSFKWDLIQRLKWFYQNLPSFSWSFCSTFVSVTLILRSAWQQKRFRFMSSPFVAPVQVLGVHSGPPLAPSYAHSGSGVCGSCWTPVAHSTSSDGDAGSSLKHMVWEPGGVIFQKKWGVFIVAEEGRIRCQSGKTSSCLLHNWVKFIQWTRV